MTEFDSKNTLKIIDIDQCSIQDVRDTCLHGFFYVPIRNIAVNDMMQICKNYFSQSLEIKCKDMNKKNGLGYIESGTKKIINQIEIMETKELYSYRTGEIGTNISESLDHYIDVVSEYAKQIFRLIIESLDQSPDEYAHNITKFQHIVNDPLS